MLDVIDFVKATKEEELPGDKNDNVLSEDIIACLVTVSRSTPENPSMEALEATRQHLRKPCV